MYYREPFFSKLVFSCRETKRKTKLFNKKLGKAWHSKKEYLEHFFRKHTKKTKVEQTPSSTVEVHLAAKQPIAGDSLIIGEDRLAVYTCVFGGYDDVEEPFVRGKYCDYYIVSDRKISPKSKWKQIEPKEYPEGFDTWHPAIKNRYFKMHPDMLFPEYKYSLYMDGNVRPMADMYPFLVQMKNENKIIGLFDHPCGYCIYASAKSLVKLDLINAEGAEKQVARYRQERFPENYGFFECNFILREHNSSIIKNMMKTWWYEYLNGEKRDQMCFTYALWKNGMQFSDVCNFGKNWRKNSRLKEKAHNRPHSKVE